MTNPHLGGDAIEHLDSIIPDTHEMRLIGLIEACKIVIKEIEGGRVEFASYFLSWAVDDAEKPPKILPSTQHPMPDAQ